MVSLTNTSTATTTNYPFTKTTILIKTNTSTTNSQFNFKTERHLNIFLPLWFHLWIPSQSTIGIFHYRPFENIHIHEKNMEVYPNISGPT